MHDTVLSAPRFWEYRSHRASTAAIDEGGGLITPNAVRSGCGCSKGLIVLIWLYLLFLFYLLHVTAAGIKFPPRIFLNVPITHYTARRRLTPFFLALALGLRAYCIVNDECVVVADEADSCLRLGCVEWRVGSWLLYYGSNSHASPYQGLTGRSSSV